MGKKLGLYEIPDDPSLEVTTYNILKLTRFDEDGLYSERIFGPVHDYVCRCGIYSETGERCPDCGVRHVKSSARSETMGFIRLPFKVVNPLIMLMLDGRYHKKVVDLMMMKTFITFGDFLDINFHSIKEFKGVGYTGADGFLRLMDRCFSGSANYKDYMTEPLYNKISRYKKHLVTDRIPVLPPDLRPSGYNSGEMVMVNPLTEKYMKLLIKKEILQTSMYANGELNISSLTVRKYIQRICNEIYISIFHSLGGKKGIIRGNILGKRMDFSGRAVATIDPSVKHNECRIPYRMLLEVYKLNIASLLSKDIHEPYMECLKKIEDEIRRKDSYEYLELVERFVEGKGTVLNRQPTLHEYGMLAFDTTVSTDDTIKVHPMLCAPTNLDQDGDSCIGSVEIEIEGQRRKVDLAQFPYDEESKTTKNNVDIYDVPEGIKVSSIREASTGHIRHEMLPVTKYSVHKELEAYDIEFNDGNIITVSGDHSLVCWDIETERLVPVKPLEAKGKVIPVLLKPKEKLEYDIVPFNNENGYILRKDAKRISKMWLKSECPLWVEMLSRNTSIGWVYILNIKKREEKMTMYDLTIPGPYKFVLNDRVIVQDSMNGRINLYIGDVKMNMHMEDLANL